MPHREEDFGDISNYLSISSKKMVRRLSEMGIYGRTPAEVAARFIDQVLQSFADPPRIMLKGPPDDGGD